MHSLPTEAAVARTYQGSSYVDPTDAIADYREHQREWATTELGSQAISTRMELPRGRIRSWEDGAKPDVVRGIETAREHGWLECPVDSETFAALNRLVAGVFSGGSISKVFVPSFSAPDDEVETQLRADLESLGVGCKLVLSNSGNVEELRPEQDASVLGRVLVALGAPQGPKPDSIKRLPAYVNDVSGSVRRDFVRVYVSNRGVDLSSKNLIQIQEERESQYLDALAALIESTTGVDVSVGERSLRFKPAGMDALGLSD